MDIQIGIHEYNKLKNKLLFEHMVTHGIKWVFYFELVDIKKNTIEDFALFTQFLLIISTSLMWLVTKDNKT